LEVAGVEFIDENGGGGRGAAAQTSAAKTAKIAAIAISIITDID
jgi:hypothetical protein